MTFSVVHDIPGRLRLRVAGAPTDLADALRRQPGVAACAWSPRTRSLLVHYAPGETTAHALVDAVANHLGEETPSTRESPGVVAPAPALGRAVGRSVAEANATLGRLTGGFVDLRTLLPLALAGWAVREIVIGRAGPLAWSTALWYSHGLFRDYNLPADHA